MPTRKIDWTEIDRAYIRDGKTAKQLAELPSAKKQKITSASIRTHLTQSGLTAEKSKQKQTKIAKWEADEEGFRAHNLAKLQQIADSAYAMAMSPDTKDAPAYIRAAAAAVQTAMDVAGFAKAPKNITAKVETVDHAATAEFFKSLVDGNKSSSA